jgi:small subunit ribosomal protein S8
MNTDPIADMLTRLRNAASAHKALVRLPASKAKKNILEILVKQGLVKAVSEEKTGKHVELVVELDATRQLTLRRVSKPGQRVYTAGKDLKPVLNGLGIAVVSTSQGLMTNKEAHKKGIGGEIICEVY